MKYLLILPRALWKILFLVNFLVGLILLSPFFYVFLSKRERFPKAFALIQYLCYWILFIPGLFVKIRRETPADQLPGTAVYCANHVSYLDIVISYLVIPHYFVSMGKKELEKVPILRLFFKEMNIGTAKPNEEDSPADAVTEAWVKLPLPQGVFESSPAL